MIKHLMVDLETLATTPNAAILSLGAVTFNPNSDQIYDELYYKVELESFDGLDSYIDDGTIEWWSKQDPKAQEEAFDPNNRIDIRTVMDDFYKFCMGSSKFWSHGSTFDIIILEHYYRQIGKPYPWKFWEVRDTRTLFDLGMDPEMPQANKHHALEDARRQAIGVQNMFRKLGRKFD
ncbi:MAG: 3'-5' exoribonuclease [Verrucomicrobia bacterium]|nr:3'-5' exoribonuclease [Verrucomicrobiota bacterium]